METLKTYLKLIASNKILCNKPFSIAKNRKYDGYQRGSASMIYKLFDKQTFGGAIKNENISNKELPEKLHKPQNYKKFNKIKINSSSIDSIWGFGLAEME